MPTRDTSLLPHHYVRMCILGFLSLVKRFVSWSFWDWTNYSRTSPSKLPIRIQKRTRRSKIHSVSSSDLYPSVSGTGLITLVPARLNYPLGNPGYREELGSPRNRGELWYSWYKILPHPYMVRAVFYRRLSTCPL